MLTNRTKCLLAACLSIFLLVLFSAEINAQVEKRVVFAKGKYGASYKGTLPRNYADYDAYVLRAKRGQTLSFKLTTSDPNAYVAVFETQQELEENHTDRCENDLSEGIAHDNPRVR